MHIARLVVMCKGVYIKRKLATCGALTMSIYIALGGFYFLTEVKIIAQIILRST